MTTTAVRAGIRERIDPVLEAMITRELMGQAAPPSAIPGAQPQPGAPLAALAPALIATLASQQPQQIPIQPTPSPLATLLPVLAATLASGQQPIPTPQSGALAAVAPALMATVAGQGPQQSPLTTLLPALAATLAGGQQPIPVPQPGALAAVAPALMAAVACQPQQVAVQQPQSPLAQLFPVLMATVTAQQQPARPSPLVSALSCALAPAIASAITGRPREGREREAGEGPERLGR